MEVTKILGLSDRDAARVLNKMESLERSDIFLLQPLLEEKRELEALVRTLESVGGMSAMSASERELFEELQAEMESCSTQIGRKMEQLRMVEEEILEARRRGATH